MSLLQRNNTRAILAWQHNDFCCAFDCGVGLTSEAIVSLLLNLKIVSSTSPLVDLAPGSRGPGAFFWVAPRSVIDTRRWPLSWRLSFFGYDKAPQARRL